MKISKLSIILLVALMVSVTINFVQKKDEMPKDEPSGNPVLTNIFERKSVRDYTSQPISKENLDLLARAGMAAPTGKDVRPWKFVIITERALLDSLATALPYAKMLTKAPAAIIVCGNDDMNHNGSSYWYLDCAAASENILLAAESLGLGAVWTAVYPYEERIAPVTRLLNLPANIKPLNIIPVGHPAQKNTPKDKFNAGNIFYNRYK